MIKKVFGVFFVLCFSCTVLASTTSTKYHVISDIKVSGDDGLVYFRTSNGSWEAPGCPDATYAYIRPTLQYQDNIISTALAAKFSGSKVLFTGTCDSGGQYLQATKMWVQ